MRRRSSVGALLLASMLVWCAGTAVAVCGDGVMDIGEECDQGGTCIGSANAGEHCTADSACAGGLCTTFGGNGCAANCTEETDVPFNLVPGVLDAMGVKSGTSGVVIHTFIDLPVALTGGQVITVGKQRDGQIPVVVKAASVVFPAIAILDFACACVHGAAAKTCGGTLFEADGITLSTDCSPTYTAGDSVCTGAGLKPCTFVNGPGNTAAGVIGCGGIDDVDVSYITDGGGSTGTPSKPVITRSGHGGPGSAAIVNTIAINVVLGMCTGTEAAYGLDGQFCTPDDMPNPGESLGAAATLPAGTGTATALITNITGTDGVNLGPFHSTGTPFSCAALGNGNAAGGGIVEAFTFLNLPTVGDIAVTGALVAAGELPASCAGDCDASGDVTVNELVSMVNIALGAPLSGCTAGDTDGDGSIAVTEIIAAVNRALGACA